MSSVDVVVPCYNYGRYLEQCVESVLSQEGVDLRVLIIDDCSDDSTPDVGGNLARRDARVVFTRHAVNIGHIATYNEGLLDWATADHSLLLSADDLLTTGALGRVVRVMDAHPEVVLAFGGDIPFAEEPACPPAAELAVQFAYQIVSYEEFLATSCSLGHTPIQAPTAVVRTATQKEVGGFLPNLPHSGDTEIWLRLAALGKIAVLNTAQACRRLHAQSMSTRYSNISRLEEQRRAFAVHFRGRGGLIPERARLWRTLCQALAKRAFWDGSIALEQGNQVLYRESLRYAESLWPGIRLWPAWWRLQVKRLCWNSSRQ